MHRSSGPPGAASRLISDPRLLTALVAAVATLVYLPSISGDFFTDDVLYVMENEQLRSIPLSRFWVLFVQRTNPWEFLPLRDLSYRVDMALFGLDAAGYHFHNLLLYALCCIAMWLCATAILGLFGGVNGAEDRGPPTAASWACVVAAVLFAVHPAHAESVGWISGRKDLLSGLFALLALWQYARAVRTRRLRWANLVAAYACFALSLMSKSTSLPLVAVAVLLHLSRERRTGATPMAAARRVTIAAAPMAAIAAVFAAVALRVGADTMIRGVDPVLGVRVQSLGERAWASLEILGTLSKITIAPVNLRLIYDVHEPGLPSLMIGSLGLLTLFGGGWGALAAWRSGSVIGFGVAAFAMLCAPFLQIVPFTTWSPASERFLFLPLMGPALAMGAILAARRPVLRTSAVALLALAGVTLGFSQALKWGATEALISDAARLSPAVADAQRLSIEFMLVPAGRHDEALEEAARVRDPLSRFALQKYVRAHRAYQAGDLAGARVEARGLELSGVATAAHFLLLGGLAEAEGDDVEAARAYVAAERFSHSAEVLRNARAALGRVRTRHAARLSEIRRRLAANPDDIVTQGNLANLEMELFLLGDAIARYRHILSTAPEHPVARYNLGLSYARAGRHAEAAAEIEHSLRVGMRGASAWNNLALARERTGASDAAVTAYRQAVQIDPSYCFAWVNLGRLYLSERNLQGALEALEAAKGACGAELTGLIDTYLELARL